MRVTWAPPEPCQGAAARGGRRVGAAPGVLWGGVECSMPGAVVRSAGVRRVPERVTGNCVY